MPRLIFHYYKTLMQFNLPFSLFVALIGMYVRGGNLVHGYVSSFNLSLLTGGFILSLYFYEHMYRQQYYFYYNRGLSRLVLILTALGINLLLALSLYTFTVVTHA